MRVFDLGIAPYLQVQDLQRRLRTAVIAQRLEGVLLMLEHPPVITLGARGGEADLRFKFPVGCAVAPVSVGTSVPVVISERGGAATLHAPGQLVSYPIVPLPRRDLHAYVSALEQVLIDVLALYGVQAVRFSRHPGVYAGSRKIGSLGLRCERWVASHGTSLNVDPDISLFDLIVSCGEPSLCQTSILRETGEAPPMSAVKARYREAFARELGLELAPLTHVEVGEVEAALYAAG